MSADPALFRRLAGETKALLLINEWRLQQLGAAELRQVLDLLAGSDVERLGLVELVRRLGTRHGLTDDQVQRLVAGLEGNDDHAEPTIVRPGLGRTIRVRRDDLTAAAAGVDQHAQAFRVKPVGSSSSAAIPAPPPAATSAPAPPPASAKAQEDGMEFGAPGGVSLFRARPKKVLLADDDTRVRMVFRKPLEDAGYFIEEVADGERAWQLLQEKTFDVAILDLKMPKLHGLEVLSRLVAAGKSLPVIICSAYEQLQDEFVISTYPNLRFLPKPVSMDRLLSTVNEMTDAAR